MNTDTKNRHENVLNDKADRKALIRSTVEWFVFVIIVVLTAFVLLHTVFGIYEADLNGEKINVLITKTETAEKGNTVAVEGKCACVAACEGEKIPDVDTIFYQNKLYGRNDFSQILDEGESVPKGLTLVTAIPQKDKGRAELIENHSITGEVNFVVHPYICFGKNVDEAVRE